MKYQVELHETAKQDYHSLFGYICQRSLEGAIHWDEAFEIAMNRLKSNPHACGYAPEESIYKRGLR